MSFSKVQSNHGRAPVSQLSFSVAFTSNVTINNLLIAYVSPGQSVGTTITDTRGNTWTKGPDIVDLSSGASIGIWYAVANATGSCTATITNGSTNQLWMMGLVEYNITNALLDQTSGQGGLGSGNGKPTSITTGKANTLVVAAAVTTTNVGSDSWSVTGGFVIDDNFFDIPIDNASLVAASLNVAASGTAVQPTFSNPGWSFGVDACQLSFYQIAIVVNCNNPPNGLVGVPYTTTFTASGGVSPYTFTISAGSLPPGLTLASTGVVTGVPTTAGLYSFTVQATDANSSSATVVCTINILNTSTLRFEIPQKRWFPHAYGDNIVTHYLDETYLGSVNNEQLLMLSSTLGFIYRSGGNTDNSLPILSAAITPSLDGGLIRLQKLYVDVMTDLDGTGTLVANMQFNNQTINGTSVSYTTNGTRGIQLQNISSLSSLNLYRNASVAYTWTGGPAGPRIYRSEVAGYVQPYISTFWVTQFINLAFPGWKHHRRLYAGYISNNTLLFTIKTQDGRTYGPYTLPSTSGQFKIIPLMLDQDIKDLAFAYQINGQGNNFVLFPESWTIETKEWTEPSYLPLAIFNT